MALCCIGGVCVPYSAVVPLFFLAVRWLLQKVIALGLLPESVLHKLEKLMPNIANTPQSTKYTPGNDECANVGNEQTSSCCAAKQGGEHGVITVESEDQFRKILKNSQVVCKFTADWCRPCQEINPVYTRLAQEHPSATFCTVDVDDLEDIAAEYKIAMMPTFLVFKNGQVSDTKTGIDLLEDFVQKSLK